MKNYIIIILVLAISITSCRKNEVSSPSPIENRKGKPTEKGTPVGAATSKSIGREGGTFSSPDNKITITVPAGAVTATTVFSIQPIENKAPNGIGSAYRLLPEGIQFAQPVIISFSYDDVEIEGSAPEHLFAAYQDKEGVWKGQRKTTRNNSNKTVSVTSLHFSDWAVFENFRLDVGKTVLQTNESTTLVVKEVNFLASLTDPESDLDEVTTTEKTGNWKLIGQGFLSAHGAEAGYTAPPVEPTPNPVIVSVEVQDVLTGNGTKTNLKLFANILVADSYMEVKFGQTSTRYKYAEASVGNGMIMINGSDGSSGIALYVHLPGPGSMSFDVKELTPTYAVASFGGKGYASFYDECEPNRKTVATGGSISISAVGAIGQYIDGSFNGQLAQGDGPCGNPSPINVSGRFHCKRRT